MSCNGGCSSCNSCNSCSCGKGGNYPIIDVNCLPTIGRTTSRYFYRTPDGKLWYTNGDCSGWVDLLECRQKQNEMMNIILDMQNKLIELENAQKEKEEEKPTGGN